MDMNIVTPEEVGFSSTRLNRIGKAMQGYVDKGQPPGMITLVARRGKVVHFQCFGTMDVEAGKPMRPDTIFRIYSMTKPIASIALMMLFEEGHFGLDDPVSRFIPEFSDLKVFVRSTATGVELADLEREMTIWNLLTHTAGLGYALLEDTPVEDMYREAGMLDPLRVLQVSLQDMVQALAKLPLAHQPGSDWRYSFAHDVIGYLVGLISDMPFDTFLEERIFNPLGMEDTGFFVPEEKLERFAAMYSALGKDSISLVDTPATSPFSRPDTPPSGGGGLVSTTSDYLRFTQMLLNGGELNGTRLLSRETLELMTRNHLPDELVPMHFGPDPWPGMGYGLGFGVCGNTDQTGYPASEGTFGWMGWAGTQSWVDPREELIILWMTQFRLLTEPVSSTFDELTYQALVD